jgi:hypothetical protein
MSDEQIEQLRQMLKLGLAVFWDNRRLGCVTKVKDEEFPVATISDGSGHYIALAGVGVEELSVYAPVKVEWMPD